VFFAQLVVFAHAAGKYPLHRAGVAGIFGGGGKQVVHPLDQRLAARNRAAALRRPPRNWFRGPYEDALERAPQLAQREPPPAGDEPL